MSDDAATTIVDLITHRPISEIDTTSDDVKERLIALECGHIFTVETLDDLCSMSEYYEIDPMTGCYTAMKAPPVEFQTPPVCPTCRGPITSPRYGRVTKRANLDILERNFAYNMPKRLEKHGLSLEAVAADLEAAETAAKAIVNGSDFASEGDFARICEERKGLFGKPDEPLPVAVLKELKKYHGFSQREAHGWNKITKEINRVYNAMVVVAFTRSAHVKAYEAAMAALFKLEMEAIARDPSSDGEAQREVVFTAVNAKIGQPPRKADRKYQIEVFLLSIELRLMLAQIASARVSKLPLTSKVPDHPRHRQIWATFVDFLYDSCIKDCEKAASLARSCSALRQEARVSIMGLRCNFEKVQFDVLERRRKIQISGGSGDDQLGMRISLGGSVSQPWAAAQEALLEARTRYLRHLPVGFREEEEMDEEVLWFEESCTDRAEDIFAAYRDLQEQVLKAKVSSQPASLRDEEDIIEALSFGMQRAYPIRLFSPFTIFLQVMLGVSATARTDTRSPPPRYVTPFPMPDIESMTVR